ncbi:hypothetical protein COL516b_003610 [Colletotrichum fioriniae]|nr:uncharacterized protein COL516b_003610 [Colletotrichum fioriniae]KAJ0308341.1 hypothetical protein COL516b_003610 [Colletotrichum fioriniae]
MSAGPGPPKSPAPHPPRRGQSVTAGRLTRYRSVREHKSVLDFGRNWRDWEVDIFQDDETTSNATTETGTATSIALGLGIGIAVDEEEGAVGGVDDVSAAAAAAAANPSFIVKEKAHGAVAVDAGAADTVGSTTVDDAMAMARSHGRYRHQRRLVSV